MTKIRSIGVERYSTVRVGVIVAGREAADADQLGGLARPGNIQFFNKASGFFWLDGCLCD